MYIFRFPWKIFCIYIIWLSPCHSNTIAEREQYSQILENPPPLRPFQGQTRLNSICGGNLRDRDALNLADVVQAAICANLDLKIRAASVLEQDANLDLGKSKFWPTIEGNISGSRFGKDVYYKNFSSANYSLLSYTGIASVSLNWIIYDGGARAANIEQAEHLLASAKYTHAKTLMDTAIAASETFYKAQYATESVVAASKALERSNDGLELAKRTLELGVSSRGDELLAKATFIQARVDLQSARATERDALSELANLAGLSRDAPISVVPQIKKIDVEKVLEDVAYLIQEGSRQNPIIMAALEEARAADSHQSVVQAQRRPTVGLAASTSQSLTPPSESSTEQRIRGWSIGLQVKIPIFSGFSSYHEEQIAESQRIAKRVAVRIAEKDIASQLWQQKAQIESQLSKLSLVSDLLETTEYGYSTAIKRYKAGVGSMIELLQAQKSLAEAVLQKKQTISVLLIAEAKLAALIGKY